MRRHLIPAGFALVYLWTFPYFPSLRSANEMPRILLTEEMVDHHTFSIDARMSELGSTFDVVTAPDGHHYSNKAPGMSLLAVPAYAVMRLFGRPSIETTTWAFRFTTSTLPALFFLPVFWRETAHFTESEPARRAAFLAYALGSMALPYALLFMSHQTAAACAGTAFVLSRDSSRKSAFNCGGALAFAIVLDYQSIFIAAIVAAYFLYRRARDAGFAIAGAAPPLLFVLIYHHACFGSPFRTGYSFAADPMQQHGFLGIVGPNWIAFEQLLIDPSNGLLILMPWILLALIGAPVLWRRRRAEAVVCILAMAAYILFIGSTEPEVGRAGWSVGPRYITVMLPFCAWLCAAGMGALDGQPVERTLAHASILVGVVIYVIAATTYPHWPTQFANPFYEVSIRSLRENLAPPSLGGFLPGRWALVPQYAVAAALALYLLGRRVVTTVVAIVLAALVLVSYSRLPRTPNPDPIWANLRATWHE